MCLVREKGTHANNLREFRSNTEGRREDSTSRKGKGERRGIFDTNGRRKGPMWRETREWNRVEREEGRGAERGRGRRVY